MSEDDKIPVPDYEENVEKAKMVILNLILRSENPFVADGTDSMKFAQAALNAANALVILKNLD